MDFCPSAHARQGISGKVYQNGIPLYNVVVEKKGFDSINNRSPCGFTIAEVLDLRTWYAQIVLQVISHIICIGDCSLQVWDMGQIFIFIDSDNQCEDTRWPM